MVKYPKPGLLGISFIETGDEMRNQDENSTQEEKKKPHLCKGWIPLDNIALQIFWKISGWFFSEVSNSIRYSKLGLFVISFIETGDEVRSQDDNSTQEGKKSTWSKLVFAAKLLLIKVSPTPVFLRLHCWLIYPLVKSYSLLRIRSCKPFELMMIPSLMTQQ